MRRISEGFASAASPFHVHGAGLGAVSEAFCESWGVSGCLLVLLWGHLGSLGVLCESLGVLWGSPWDPWESFGVPGSPFGVPWGSLGGPLERLGDEGMRWDTKMSFLPNKTKVLGSARGQHVIFAQEN